MQIAKLHLQLNSEGWGPIICISNMFPDVSDVRFLDHTLRTTHLVGEGPFSHLSLCEQEAQNAVSTLRRRGNLIQRL